MKRKNNNIADLRNANQLYYSIMCSKRDSNSHGHFCPKDFKSFVSTIPPFERPRAENETRTRDPNLGKVVLYQLSYFRKCGKRTFHINK